ncbi:hypothetical protein NQ315_001121 [Exocentrus adspersus]|uniref:Glutathione transferase n=1 Tax=Exocentrus adspersus TaxID=1586481 RepID=A0AAV8WGT5_9CUCU|nr:hypothetical protein NQ315_001121 [Exocentrus adspersus]
MTPKLYYADVSPAVRSTLLAVKALDIDLELVPVNLMAGEHLKPEFLQLNPLHTVPTLEDGDFAIFDSHAINTYLAGKYGKDDSLYPKDLQRRAVVDQRMYFNCGVLFPRMGAIVVSLLREGAKTVSKDKADLLTQGYSSLETLLERSTFVAGEQLSLADFSIVATVSSANVLVPIASNTFPRITEWLAKMQALPYYAEANQVGLDKFVLMVKSRLDNSVDIQPSEMPVKLYGVDASPVVRATLLTFKALDLDFELKEVNVMKGEQLSPEFLEINPMHTIPTIQDGDFTLWDSHAINAYLVDEYGKDDALYPKDAQKRAVVDQRMYFECGVLFTKFGAFTSVLMKGNKALKKERMDSLVEGYGSLETLLEHGTYVAGEQLTIADFSVVATLTTANVLVPIASNRFPKISQWLSRMQALPYYREANQVGLDKFAVMVKKMLG